MLALEEDVEAQALRAQGWSVSAIARHLGRDRKTIRRYLSGDVVPGKLGRRGRIRSSRSSPTAGLGWPMTRTCGRRRCWTRSPNSATAVRSVTCPPRRGNRKGVVEKADHSAAQRWWRTLGDEVTVLEAQAGLDRPTAKLDGRRRVRDGDRPRQRSCAACP
jgi:hypothetical protein